MAEYDQSGQPKFWTANRVGDALKGGAEDHRTRFNNPESAVKAARQMAMARPGWRCVVMESIYSCHANPPVIVDGLSETKGGE